MEEEHEPKTQTSAERDGIGGNRNTRIGGRLFPDAFVCFRCRRIVLQAEPMLPYMDAFICCACKLVAKHLPILESEITNKTFAPWNTEEVSNLNRYQDADDYLPFVCTRGHVLHARAEGLFCPRCHMFSLKWAYPWILDGSW